MAAGRVGIGISVDNKGTPFFEFNIGIGSGFAASLGAGISYSWNASTTTQATLTANAGGGVGPVGGTVQGGYGWVTGLGVNASGGPGLAHPLSGGKVGIEGTVTVNAEVNEQLGGPSC